MPRKLLTPEDARAWLRRRYAAQHQAWLSGAGSWPLGVPLGDPTERNAAQDVASVREWVDAWRRWSDGGEVEWVDRVWPRLGTQSLPVRLVLSSAADVARVAGEARRFERAAVRHARLSSTWDNLSDSRLVSRNFDVLADYSDDDFERLVALLRWFDENRGSNRYLRQLPIEGLDTKWCDSRRRALIMDLIVAIRGLSQPLDFYELCGLRRAPQRLRMRVLCNDLRRAAGGLCDVEAPVEQVAALDIQPACALIVENLETGIALPDLPGCIAFMKLGNGVGVLAQIPWLQGVRAVYWGDIDTHGFAILGHARGALPALTSILMDESTLLANRALWGREAVQYAAGQVPHLTADEHAVFDNLRNNVWGQGVRLEQERVPWERALEVVRNSVRGRSDPAAHQLHSH